jgi:hypothetical protein
MCVTYIQELDLPLTNLKKTPATRFPTSVPTILAEKLWKKVLTDWSRVCATNCPVAG